MNANLSLKHQVNEHDIHYFLCSVELHKRIILFFVYKLTYYNLNVKFLFKIVSRDILYLFSGDKKRPTSLGVQTPFHKKRPEAHRGVFFVGGI